MKFPKEYIREGDFVLHSGGHSKFKYDVERALTDPVYFNFVLGGIPFSNHYIGIATGGLIMAATAHTEVTSSKFSYVKNGKLVGDRPEAEWILLDDVVTTGSSLREAINIVGSKPESIYVAVDRREVRERIGGLEVNSIFDI